MALEKRANASMTGNRLIGATAQKFPTTRKPKHCPRHAAVFGRSHFHRSETTGLASRSLACHPAAPEVSSLPRTWQ